MAIHRKKCPDNHCNTVQISLDGVTQSKSSSVSLDIYSTSFNTCRIVYPMTIIRPINRFPIGYRQYLDKIIKDLHSCHCTISQFIRDNPKRAIVREALNHAAHYACEYCISKAGRAIVQKTDQVEVAKITEAITFMQQLSGSSEMARTKDKHLQSLEELKKTFQSNRKRTHLAWPHNTSRGQARTDDSTEAIVNGIEEGILDHDTVRGIIGRSLFLDLNYFNFTQDIPAEYMHSVCLGLVKQLIELTFTVGKTRSRVSTRRLSTPSKYNSLMSTIQVPREFSRRVRNLDLSVIKAQEYRNIALIFFPVMIECIEKQAKERRAWLLLAYMIRSCVLPNAEFTSIDMDIKDICDKFYALYEQLFGIRNCSYTVHVVATHLLNIRGNQPLTETSAFKYENFYSEVRNSFAAGTQATLKQIFQRTQLKRALSFHSCILPIFYSEKTSRMEANNLIYIFENNEYNIYKIHTIHENLFLCHKQGYFQTSYRETPEIEWKSVGVFKEGGLSEETYPINKCFVHGKVVRVCGLLITVPINVLRES